MKNIILTILTLAAFAPGTAFAGGLSTIVLETSPMPQPRPEAPVEASGGFYIEGGLGMAETNPNYSSDDVYLDWHWFKKEMHSELVDSLTDLANGDPSASLELGYTTPIGTSGLFAGAALDYTHLGFSESATCHVDAKLAQNPKWPRPDHTCGASMDGVASAILLLGYDFDNPLRVHAFAGVARGFGSQSWEGQIERRPAVIGSSSDFEVDGTTYGLQADYALDDNWMLGVEWTAYDFDSHTVEHDWADTKTDFDVQNVSVVLTYNLN